MDAAQRRRQPEVDCAVGAGERFQAVFLDEVGYVGNAVELDLVKVAVLAGVKRLEQGGLPIVVR